MNAFLGYVTVLVLFVLLAGPALVGHLHERRIDRQLRAAEHSAATRKAQQAQRAEQAQKSSSRSTVPSTATWYADGRRSKKLVSS
nr:hypothetical protein [Streptomyces curacoi]